MERNTYGFMDQIELNCTYVKLNCLKYNYLLYKNGFGIK